MWLEMWLMAAAAPLLHMCSKAAQQTSIQGTCKRHDCASPDVRRSCTWPMEGLPGACCAMQKCSSSIRPVASIRWYLTKRHRHQQGTVVFSSVSQVALCACHAAPCMSTTLAAAVSPCCSPASPASRPRPDPCRGSCPGIWAASQRWRGCLAGPRPEAAQTSEQEWHWPTASGHSVSLLVPHPEC